MRRNKRKPIRLSAAKQAYLAGRKAAGKQVIGKGPPSFADLNGWWCKYRQSWPEKVVSWRGYFSEAGSFLLGFSRSAGIKKPDLVLLPTKKTVSAVVTAMNEANTLRPLLRQLNRLPISEIIVVVNGSSDDSFSIARDAGAMVVHYSDPIGHDVGRAVGAEMATSDIVLFLDGDIPVKAEQLVPFIYSVHCGSDIALNNIRPFLGPLSSWDNVTVVKEFLNRCLDRQDLSANSLTAVPHAMSRKALETIGIRHLAVPPKAQIIALQSGLKVTTSTGVNVIKNNKRRQDNVGLSNPVSELIIGDHFEALHMLRLKKGPRMGFADSIRKREAPGGVRDGNDEHGHTFAQRFAAVATLRL